MYSRYLYKYIRYLFKLWKYNYYTYFAKIIVFCAGPVLVVGYVIPGTQRPNFCNEKSGQIVQKYEYKRPTKCCLPCHAHTQNNQEPIFCYTYKVKTGEDIKYCIVNICLK